MAASTLYDPVLSPKLDAVRVVGKPLDRRDGRAKVTGEARYASEYRSEPQALYGFIVEATIAKGRIRTLETKAVEAAPGVRLVMTHLNAPPQAEFGLPAAVNRNGRPRPVLADVHIRHFGEPIALVVADSFEQARAAAALMRADYDREPASFMLNENLQAAYRPDRVGPGFAADSAVGDFEPAFAEAAVQVDATYHNARQNHNPL